MKQSKFFATLEKTFLPNLPPLYKYKGCLYIHVKEQYTHHIREYDSEGKLLRKSSAVVHSIPASISRGDMAIIAIAVLSIDDVSQSIPLNEPFLIERFQRWGA